MKLKILSLCFICLFIYCCGGEKQANPSSGSVEIKSEEKLIADSPASLKEFLKKTATKLKTHLATSPYPEKGEFETTQEVNIRALEWHKKIEMGNSILYKATDLFPVKLGRYIADKNIFNRIYLDNSFYQEIKEFQEQTIPRSYNKVIEFSISGWADDRHGFGGAGHTMYIDRIYCPREQARTLREDNLRYDITFNIGYTPSERWGNQLRLYLQEIKLYSKEAGEITTLRRK